MILCQKLAVKRERLSPATDNGPVYYRVIEKMVSQKKGH